MFGGFDRGSCFALGSLVVVHIRGRPFGSGLWEFVHQKRGIMIRKRLRRRPELESLETMVLLSGISALEHHGAAAMVARETQAGGLITLSGTAKGTFKAAGKSDNFLATGSLSPLGKISLKGSVNFAAGTGSLIIASTGRKHGKITASLTPNGPTNPVPYKITSASGIFAGDTGSGEAVFDAVTAHGKGPAHGKVTIIFENIPV
jgi:hypothetical protein